MLIRESVIDNHKDEVIKLLNNDKVKRVSSVLSFFIEVCYYFKTKKFDLYLLILRYKIIYHS